MPATSALGICLLSSKAYSISSNCQNYSCISGTPSASTNLSAGTAGQIPYQTGAGATGFFGNCSNVQIIQGSGVGSPQCVGSPTLSTMTLQGTGNTVYSLTTSSGINALSPGLIVAPAGFVGPIFGTGTGLTGTAANLTAGIATNISGGAAGQIPFQSGASVTQFTSTFTVSSSGNIGIGTSTPASKIHMSSGTLIVDGNTNPGMNISITGTSPAAIFSPNLSSFTISGAISGTFTGTINAVCIAGSTLTLNFPTNVGRARVNFSGAVQNGNIAASITMGFLLDGAYTLSQTSAIGIISSQQAIAAENINLSFNRLMTGLSAASHTVCLTGFVSAGTATIDSTLSTAVLEYQMLP